MGNHSSAPNPRNGAPISEFARLDSAIYASRNAKTSSFSRGETALKVTPSIALLMFNFDKVEKDTRFLHTLSLSMDYWRSDDVLGQKIRVLVDQMEQDFASVAQRASVSERLGVVRNSQALMCDLVSEFGESVEDFRVFERLQVSELGSFLQLWSEFVKSTQQCLTFLKMRFCVNDANVVFAPQIDSLHTILSSFLDFVTSIGEPLLLKYPDFMAHAVSVVTCVANRSCCCWFLATDAIAAKGKITGILDLQPKIDLAHREFFSRCFYIFQATSELSCLHLEYFFLRYLLKYACTSAGLFEELVPLVRFAIKNDAGFPEKYLLGEIEELLFSVGLLFQPYGFLPPELLVKMCLLKVEVLLQQFLQDGNRFSRPELNAAVDKLKVIASTLGDEEQTMEFVVARDIQALFTFLGAEDTTELSVRNFLLFIRMKIVVLKSKYFLRGSPNFNTLEEEDHLLKSFKEGLDLFTSIVTNLQLDNSENVVSILADAEDFSRSIISFSYSYFFCKNREEVVANMKILFPKSLCIMNFILSRMSPIYPQLNVSNINVLRLTDVLLENLQDLPIHDSNSLSIVKHFVEEIQVTLQSWRPFLTAYVDLDAAENLELSNLSKQATLVVYKVACVIDLIEVDGVWQHAWWLYNLIQEMRLIDNQVPANPLMRQSSHEGHNVSRLFPRINKTREEMVVASRGDQEGSIINELKRGSRQQYIVSIFGMPGIGKTTLAKKVFNDPNIVAHFHRFTWCSVSQLHGKKDLLLEILKDTDGLCDLDDLEVKLYRLLKQHRYLIVLDDLWDVEALNTLADAFHENGNGSKILITTRDHKVASDARPKGGDPCFLHPLTEEESWDLLKMKLFPIEGPEGSCPDELVEVGKEIAQACKGLPLSIVAVAGILGRREKTVEFWRKIRKNLNKQIIDDQQTQCKDILELSYMCLPPHLRECFLYLGAFLEYRDVSVSNLIRLWIAEGFIEKNGPEKSLEDIAEDYLMDLIDRSLVMISRKRSNGMVKTCSIHDLLHDFCLMKAKIGNLFQLITNRDEPYASFGGVEYGHELYEHCRSNPVLYEGHRVCMHLKRKHFVDSRPSGPWTRSLMLLPSVDANPRFQYDISFIPQHFRLLTVLNLECIHINNGFPPDIENLVHLRYLAVTGNVNSIPESIEKVWRLETLIVKGSSVEIGLPSTIWRLVKLRHLHVKLCTIFIFKDYFTEIGSLMLHDLVTFSSPVLTSGMENVIMGLPNLRKLSCMFCKSWGTRQFPELRYLTRLESLRIIYSGTALTSADFRLPDSLKKLTLSKFALPWNQIDAIARLPNLEVLKLVCRAYEGTLWEMGDIEFPVLKFLMLDSLNISQWVGYSHNLPMLEKLVLKNCNELEEVPSDFAGIDTLVTIEVQSCKQSVAQSVLYIKADCEAVRVIIGSAPELRSN